MSAMEFTQGSWVRFGARSMILSGAIAMGVFVGLKFANAGPGEPVRKALTVSGVLTGAPASAMATFRFYRAVGDATPLCAPEVPIRNGIERDLATGAFSVEVPLDQTGHACPDALFHDPSAYVEVAIGATVVVTRRPINPVPYAVFAQQYGTPDCPVGYQLQPPNSDGTRPCTLTREDGVNYDSVVRVGTGPTAFWIDRYEATIWSTFDARGEALNSNGEIDLTSLGLPRTGEWSGRTPRLYARSRGIDVLPARWVTWFQAEALCRASGKRLPTGPEWLAAARGTQDSGCNISTSGPRGAGSAFDYMCDSEWGAHDMIGNLWEWTSDWYASVGQVTSDAGSDRNAITGRRVNDARFPWPTEAGRGYARDATWNVSSIAARGPGDEVENTMGMPAGALRGGAYDHHESAGVFALSLTEGPSSRLERAGFRCVIPR